MRSKKYHNKCNVISPDVQHVYDNNTLLRVLGLRSVAGLYAHIPFCVSKCDYCDFYSVVAGNDQYEVFVRRLIEEIESVGKLGICGVEAIYIGGGTPTVLSDDMLWRILAALGRSIEMGKVVEFTVECNPGTVTDDVLRVLADGGVNRLSIGAQSFCADHLGMLGRRHCVGDIERTIAMARERGLSNISLDLIFGVPGQSIEDWRADLARSVDIGVSHLSCYGLTYERGTRMCAKLERGLIQRCDEALEMEMLGFAIDYLTGMGFEHYEISNFALPGMRCRHNMMYWQNGNWLAFGPGAAGHVDGVRWRNVGDVDRYIESSRGVPIVDVEKLNDDAGIGEQLMMRLRVIEGVDMAWLDENLDKRRRVVMEQQMREDLLEIKGGKMRLTRGGLMIADTIVEQLL